MIKKTQYFIRAIQNTSSAGSFKLFHSSSIIFADLSTETKIEELELEKRVKFLKTFASDLDKSESKTLEKVNELENLNDSISSYSESFSNVDPNDPFFGIFPKILKSIVTNEEIPLGKILEEKGLFLGSIYLFNKFPLSTILATKKGIVITDKEIEVITELKDKIENIETRINTLENKTKVFEELDNKLNELANRSIMAIKAVDKGDIALLGLQFVSPFLIYRGILNTYGKLVIDNTYKPKNIEEQKYIEKNRIRLISRFNRIGIPILLVSYLTVSQINIEKNKAIIQSMKDTILGVFNQESSSTLNSSLFLFLSKNKNNILISLIPVLIIFIGYFIKPVIYNNYPWLYNLLNLYGLKFSFCLIFMWVFILCLDSGLELIIYKFYIKNNAKIKFPEIIEWLINTRYIELWDQSQSTFKIEHNKFYVRNFYFHLIILFIIFILLIYILI